ncbi:MAG TPA: sigma 54-interacting transcriptional regulator [Pseudomonadota bacterium]|nr:sigma 54-interacting transcriptional regulator [Pseudomonadota bacterium]
MLIEFAHWNPNTRMSHRSPTAASPDATQTIHARRTFAGGLAGLREPAYLLIVEAGSSSLCQLPEQGEVIIGRSPEVMVRLHDPAASRHHARLQLGELTDGGAVVLSDLGSHNGTRLNGERLTAPRRLSSGDVIAVCDVTLIFQDRGRTTSRRPLYDEPSLLQARLEEEIERSLSSHRPVSVVALHVGDLDSASRVRVELQLGVEAQLVDVLAWGSQTHVLLLLPDRDVADAELVAERLVESLVGLVPQIKAGVAGCPDDGYHAHALLLGARAAMEAAPVGQVRTAAAAVTMLQLGDKQVVLADPAMLRLYTLIERLAPSDLPVLVCGETGTGKEIAAQALHQRSRRAAGRLVSLNCAALPETLAESELFGHEKGAFTGAVAQKVGLLEAAQGGTLFLDEIGELSLGLQAKLLRALEQKRITRVGDTKERSIDIRIVAATNRKLAEESAQGRFRQDLYFRLSGAVLHLPPLRDRTRELPILARTFLTEACARMGKPAMLISPSAMDLLLRYSWPGNLRELRNAMDYAAATALEPVLESSQLPMHLLEAAGRDVAPPQMASSLAQIARSVLRLPYPDKFAAIEEALIGEALTLAKGNKSAAARLLGVHRKVIERRLDKKLGNDPE